MSIVALLRAVNVGGLRLPMADLRDLLEGLGLKDVRTYLQSGNAVFDADDDGGPPQALAAAIERRIQRDIGARVRVLVLSGDAVAAVAAANPFLSCAGAPSAPDVEKCLHATFLFGPSDGAADGGSASAEAYSAACEAAFQNLQLPADEGEEAAIVGYPLLAAPVVFLKLPHGYGRTKLNNAYFERKLRTDATTRNWRTVKALAAMAGADGSGAPAQT